MVACVSVVSCLCIHSCIFSWYVFVVYYENSYLERLGLDTRKLSYGGHWRYLTYLNLVLQTGFFGLCVLTDIVTLMSSGRVPSLLLSIRDDIFTTFTFPYATFVFCTFWTANATDRAHYTPLIPGDQVTPFLNHARHTIIVPLVLIQMFIQNHQYSPRLKSFSLMFLSGSLYISWLLFVHHASGIWVYGVLDGISLLSQLALYGVCLGLLLLMHFLGQKLSGRIWGHLATRKKSN